MPVFQVVERQLLFDQRIINTHFVEGDTLAYGDATAIADIFGQAAEDNLGTFRDSQYAWEGVRWRRVDQAGFPSVGEGGAFSHNGTGTGSPLPYQASLVVSMSAPTTKPNRARKYLAGFTEEYTGVTNTWTSPIRTAAIAWIDQITAALETTLGADYVTARWDTANEFVTLWNTLTNFGARPQVYTQRRRVPELN